LDLRLSPKDPEADADAFAKPTFIFHTIYVGKAEPNQFADLPLRK
jgi:hypothetical protein